MRLIDADALRTREDKVMYMGRNANKTKTLVMWVVNELIKTAPTIDAVPVVRCKDCKHGEIVDPDFPNHYYCYLGCGLNRDYFFCAFGERKTDGEVTKVL